MTSIEWLIEQLMERGFQEKNFEILNQAKEMHKQEIIDAVDSNFSYSSNEYPTLGEQYYHKTFVSNESNNHISDISKMVEVHQQEISDEEIEKAARDYDNSVIYGPPLLHFEQGAFWYREQLKQAKKD